MTNKTIEKVVEREVKTAGLKSLLEWINENRDNPAINIPENYLQYIQTSLGNKFPKHPSANRERKIEHMFLVANMIYDDVRIYEDRNLPKFIIKQIENFITG